MRALVILGLVWSLVSAPLGACVATTPDRGSCVACCPLCTPGECPCRAGEPAAPLTPTSSITPGLPAPIPLALDVIRPAPRWAGGAPGARVGVRAVAPRAAPGLRSILCVWTT